MKVWIGCLACYNAGTLRGEWVDGIDAAEFVPCHGRGHEEWWVFDHEDTQGLLDGECSPVDAQRIAEAIEAIEQDGYPVEAVAAWANYTGTPVTEWDGLTSEAFSDAFCGEYTATGEYAAQLAEDIGALPDGASWPASCIDWDRAWNELAMDGYYSEDIAWGKVYIFRSC